jgi:uncharacterized protein
MHLDILGAVVVTAFIQSLFGVGVLLFGTPILLVLGHDFITTLVTLLPISISINAVQVGKHYAFIDGSFYKRIVTLTIPCVVFFLFLVTRWHVDINAVVGLFLIVVAMKNFSRQLKHLVQSLIRYERTYFTTMGIIHGLTNLGGSLLTAIVHSKNYEKDIARVTTAVSYGTFAVFQLVTLAISAMPEQMLSGTTFAYALTGVGTFFLTDRLVYAQLDTERYQAIFAAFLFVSGLLLIGKALFA